MNARHESDVKTSQSWSRQRRKQTLRPWSFSARNTNVTSTSYLLHFGPVAIDLVRTFLKWGLVWRRNVVDATKNFLWLSLGGGIGNRHRGHNYFCDDKMTRNYFIIPIRSLVIVQAMPNRRSVVRSCDWSNTYVDLWETVQHDELFWRRRWPCDKTGSSFLLIVASKEFFFVVGCCG